MVLWSMFLFSGEERDNSAAVTILARLFYLNFFFSNAQLMFPCHALTIMVWRGEGEGASEDCSSTVRVRRATR